MAEVDSGPARGPTPILSPVSNSKKPKKKKGFVAFANAIEAASDTDEEADADAKKENGTNPAPVSAPTQGIAAKKRNSIVQLQSAGRRSVLSHLPIAFTYLSAS